MNAVGLIMTALPVSYVAITGNYALVYGYTQCGICAALFLDKMNINVRRTCIL